MPTPAPRAAVAHSTAAPGYSALPAIIPSTPRRYFDVFPVGTVIQRAASAGVNGMEAVIVPTVRSDA